MFEHCFSQPKTRLNVWRCIVLLQSRCTGLTPEAAEPAYEELVEIINQPVDPVPQGTYERSYNLAKEIRPNRIDLAISREKVVLNSSACLEFPKSKGGKMALNRALLGFYPSISVDTDTGVLDFTRTLSEGNKLFATCLHLIGTPSELQRFKDQFNIDPNLNLGDARVSVVLETGLKARLVTVGSGIVANVLQVTSHFLLEVLKFFPELRTSLSGTENGWTAYSELVPENTKVNFLWSNPNVWGFSSDLKQATDYASRPFAREVIRGFLDGCGFPSWLRDLSLDLWLGPNTYMFPHGRRVRSLDRLVEQGKPITKAFLSICHLLAINRDENVYSRFNGDDCLIITDNLAVPREYMNRMRTFGFKISVNDTFFSRHWVNYCEEYFHIPHREGQSFSSQSKRSSNPSLFMDYPKIRLLLNVERSVYSHSYTLSGKYQLLSKRLGWSDHNLPTYFLWEFLYYLQDCTNHHYDDYGRVYLPLQLGGAGRIPAFYNDSEMLLFYSLDKRAIREPVFRLINRFMQWYRTGTEDPVLEKFRVYNLPKVHYHDDHDNRFYPVELDDHPWIRDYLITDQIDDIKEHIIMRLHSRGYVKTPEDIMVTSIIKKAHEYLLGLTERPPFTTASHRPPLECTGGLDRVSNYGYFIKEFRRRYPTTRVYEPEVIDRMLSTNFTINVNHYRNIPIEIDPEVDSYEPLFRRALKWLRDPQGPVPQDLIDDDLVILKMIGDNPIIITLDRKLCQEAARRKGSCVMIHPLMYELGVLDPSIVDQAVLDTGSADKVITDYFVDGMVRMPSYDTYPVNWIEPADHLTAGKILYDSCMEDLFMGRIHESIRGKHFWSFAIFNGRDKPSYFYDLAELQVDLR